MVVVLNAIIYLRLVMVYVQVLALQYPIIFLIHSVCYVMLVVTVVLDRVAIVV